MTKTVKLSRLILLPVILGLIFSLFYTGILMLVNGGAENVAKFLLGKTNSGLEQNIGALAQATIPIAGLVGVLSALALIFGLIRREFIFSEQSCFIQWGLFGAILATSIYGFGVRIISNHALAGTLFFYTAILFILLSIVQRKTAKIDTVALRNIQWLPIIFLLFYTMAFPGYQKIFNSEVVMGKYVAMFSNSFLAQLPGGIPPFIYLLGICELISGILALIAIVKGEFLTGKSKVFLRLAILVTVLTFFQLSIGLFVLVNISGAVNLLLYAIFSAILFYLIEENKAENKV